MQIRSRKDKQKQVYKSLYRERYNPNAASVSIATPAAGAL